MNELNKTSEQTGGPSGPFFSIIIPVYNAAAYIQECIESILAQDFDDWEAILVDDVSSDRSVEKAEEFSRKDARIKVFRSETNSGGPHTPRMHAASLAKGKYVVPIDADDKVSADLLSILYQSIQSSDADMVIPEMWRWNGTTAYKILPLEKIDTTKIWMGKDLVEHTLCQWAIPMAGFAVRRDIYLNSDHMLTKDDRRSSFVDELLSRWLLFMCGSVGMCNARYYYRQNEESITNVNVARFTKSRLILSNSLIDMTARSFGENSHTHLRALENKFSSAVDLLRLINRSAMSRTERTSLVDQISESMRGFDLSRIKGRVSPRYLAVMRLPIPIARIAFKILDPIIKLKNGI